MLPYCALMLSKADCLQVFNDNYLDGCYHCTFAHPGLSQALDISAYHNVLYEKVSFQVSPLADAATRPTDGEWDDIIASRVEGVFTSLPLPLPSGK